MTQGSVGADDAPNLLRRCWRAPLWAHVLALLAVLAAAAALTVPGHAATSDEGAAIVQARLLAEGTWHLADPLAGLDLVGVGRPFPLGDLGSEGLAPYAKHPAYPTILRAADAAGGVAGLVGLSVVAGALAALTGALIARRLRPDLARPTLWVLGIGSPLVFDSLLVLAHTLAAACLGAAVLAGLAALDRRGGRFVATTVGLAVASAACVLLRTEGLFAALAVACGLATAARGERRARALVLAGTVAVVAVVTLALERVLVASIVGDRQPTTSADSSGGWLTDRAEGLWNDWFDPGRTGSGDLLAMVMLGGVLLAGAVVWSARRRGQVPVVPLVVVLGVTAAACVGRLVGADPVEIFGLMVAFPLLWLAVFAVSQQALADDRRRVLAVATGAFTVAVLGTNYAAGGGVQWGGRYFAVILPAAAPLAVAVLADLIESWRARDRRTDAVVVALAIVSVVIALFAWRVVRHRHESVASLQRAVAEAADVAGPSGIGSSPDDPAVVVYNHLVPQLLYGDFDDYTWLPIEADADATAAADSLADAGLRRVVFVGSDDELAEWQGWREVARVPSRLGSVAVLER